ncbi:GDSL-type esterase/lipase family protein, partial [Arthrospira platensis SPKY1]|nr:GDSL-type esterase/lipase family protein [Arthrospira platensis SPKY1]
PETNVVLQTVLPTNADFSEFKNHQNRQAAIQAVNDGLKRLSVEFEVGLLDLHAAFLDADGKLDARYTDDGLHLNGTGYQHWRNLLMNAELCFEVD